MAILVNKDSRLIIQGITGKQARLHARYHLEYGAKLVGGITPGKAGQEVEGVPVFDTIKAAQEALGQIDATLILTPPYTVLDGALEAIDNGIKVIVVITEHIPVHDSMKIREAAQAAGACIVGPNTIGLISPGKSKLGVMPGFLYKEGRVGIVSRSGTLTHEMASSLSIRGIGQSTCVGIGGDPVPGSPFEDILKLFRDDAETDAVILIGEIGGAAEEQAATYLASVDYGKPVVAYIAGSTAPAEKKMGHAGAIIAGETGTAASKRKALEKAGVRVAETPEAVLEYLGSLIKK
jgi:succinyl-CoA synthetase alpha subunit